ncbi:MAG TPA: hypothetical protein ENI64_12250 [Gammaproteobacteria bacterium]|nr:hypothetical protein [Gammaproteobacteria bacterium]
MKQLTHNKNQKPLFSINRPIKARAYKSKFRAFETTRYLDARKLNSARKISIEVGTIEAAGRCATLVAQIQKGMIIGLKLKGCQTCTPKTKSLAGTYKRILPELARKTCAVPGRKLVLPIPLTFSQKGIIRIPIGPIVIVIQSDPEFCIMIQIGELFCVICFDYIYCGDLTPPP